MSATLVERPTVQFSDIVSDFDVTLTSRAYKVCGVCHGFDSGCDETICRGLDCD